MEIHLTPVEARVLGSLIEKDITTPDYYPLSLNALVNACNQKNNREPVMNLGENAVRDALAGLQDQRLAGPARGADSRVIKYEHRLQEVFNLTRGETALLCVLLLRGPQTPGELRGRTERMFRFEHLDDVEAALHRLIEREPPLAKILQRQPGTKEARYAHLLSGEPQQDAITSASPAATSVDGDRIGRLEAELAELRREVHSLRQEFSDLKKQ
ncbi:MAG TPA: YceH family protein [Terriglobales bacterium]|nr:YceH family protein [Terriglobales bacterium]